MSPTEPDREPEPGPEFERKILHLYFTCDFYEVAVKYQEGMQQTYVTTNRNLTRPVGYGHTTREKGDSKDGTSNDKRRNEGEKTELRTTNW